MPDKTHNHTDAKRNQALNHLHERLFNKKGLVESQKLPYDVISEYDLAKVRYYAAPHKKYRVPLVFVAPLAINMAIYDLFENRSLIRHMTNQGFDVYLIDWGRPTRKQDHYSFKYYVTNALPALLKDIRNHNGQSKISLHGWSMAGIFCVLYAAYTKDSDLKNLIILGSPFNSYASGRIGKSYHLASKIFRVVEHKTGFHPYKINYRLLHTPGWSNALGFKLLDPVGLIQGHLHLIKNLNDRDVVKAHATLGAFLNDMVDYPGAVNRDMLFNVWLQNPLIKGEFNLGNHTVYLKDIQAALLVGAGVYDELVTVEAARPLTRLVGSDDIEFCLIKGGHVGLMSNEQSAEQFWPHMTNWLAQRSSLID